MSACLSQKTECFCMGTDPEPPWKFPNDKEDFVKCNYVARVNKPFACPAYTEAYGGNGTNVYTGSKCKKKLVYRAGAQVSIMETKYADGYLSALVTPGNHWINLWTMFNRKKKLELPDGVRYCEVWREGQDSVPGTRRRRQRKQPSGHDELNGLPTPSADPAG